MTLADAPQNKRLCIKALRGEENLQMRLRELGLLEGEFLSVWGATAFGDPLLVEYRGTRLALRRSEALSVEVEE